MSCKNCDHKLLGEKKFCSNCGQKNIEHLSFRYLFQDFLDYVFNLDSKLYRTLKNLIFKPGFLSEEFVNGRRVHYVLPVKLYVVISVIFFFLISLNTVLEKNDTNASESSLIKVNGNKDANVISVISDSVTISLEKYKALEQLNQLDGYLQDSLGIKNDGISYRFEKTIMKIQAHEDRFLEVMTDYSPIFLLLFIFVITHAYRLTFFKNKLSYVNHAVFNFHLNSFVIFLLIIGQLTTMFGLAIEGIFLAPIVLVYLLIAIMKFYNRKWWVALYKLFVLTFFYSFLGIIFTVLVFMSALVTFGFVK